MLKRRKGEIATLLTLGLVLVGSLITLGTSLFISNKKTNLASNPRAQVPCEINQKNCTEICGNITLCSSSCTKKYYVPDEGTADRVCINSNSTPTPIPTSPAGGCGNIGVWPCPTDDVSRVMCKETGLDFGCCVRDKIGIPDGSNDYRFRWYGCGGQLCINTKINNTGIGGIGTLESCPYKFDTAKIINLPNKNVYTQNISEIVANAPISTSTPTPAPKLTPATFPPDESCVQDMECTKWCSHNKLSPGNNNRYSYIQTGKYYTSNNCSGNFVTHDNYEKEFVPLMKVHCSCTGSETLTAIPIPIKILTPVVITTETPIPATSQANPQNPTLPPIPTIDPNNTSQQVCSYNNSRINCNINKKKDNIAKIACTTTNGWSGLVTESVVCDQPLNLLKPCLFYYYKDNNWKGMSKQTESNDNICDINQDQTMNVVLTIENSNEVRIKSKNICLSSHYITVNAVCKEPINDRVTFSLKKTDLFDYIQALVVDNNGKTFTIKKSFQNGWCNFLVNFCNDLKDIESHYELKVPVY